MMATMMAAAGNHGRWRGSDVVIALAAISDGGYNDGGYKITWGRSLGLEIIRTIGDQPTGEYSPEALY